MRLKQHNKKDLSKKGYHQFFNPHTSEQEERSERLKEENITQPINEETNYFSWGDVPVSFDDEMSNKEFYAMRRGRQNRFSI